MVPELLDGTNHIAWFKAGAEIFSEQGIQYLGIPGLINAHSIVATLIVQVWGGRGSVQAGALPARGAGGAAAVPCSTLHRLSRPPTHSSSHPAFSSCTSTGGAHGVR